jgi:hypothetical protein
VEVRLAPPALVRGELSPAWPSRYSKREGLHDMTQYTHLISESTAGFANFTRIATIFGLDFKTPLARSGRLAPPPCQSPAAAPCGLLAFDQAMLRRDELV